MFRVLPGLLKCGFPALLAILVVSCGSNSDDAVYDTARNPHDFPRQACQLLDMIETGQLPTYDLISDGFSQLYMEHEGLLEDLNWRDVITRLGAKFQHEADELVNRGVRNYSQAAGFYRLASFAQPDNSQFTEKSRLFDAWLKGIRDASAPKLSPGAEASLSDAIDIVRHFALGDSLQNEFARRFLVRQLLGAWLKDDKPDTFAVGSLAVADHAFLAYIGLAERPTDKPIIQFIDPTLDLIAYCLTPMGHDRIRTELYFVPQEAITSNYIAVLQIDSAGVAGLTKPDSSIFLVADIAPERPSTEWVPGEVAVACSEVVFSNAVAGLAIGLRLDTEGEPRFVSARGHNTELIPLPVKIRTTPGK